ICRHREVDVCCSRRRSRRALCRHSGLNAGAGLEVVMDRCVKIEHARFFGGLHTIGLNTGVVSARQRPVSLRKFSAG
ncbi:MAG: hypothetical protein ACLFR8_14380, partial [Alkalispirochaeta sp.]